MNMENKDKNKTIVHILFNLKLGGTESMLLDIMRCQADMGHKIVLILVNNKHDEELMRRIDNRVIVKYINRPKGSKNPWYLIKLNYNLRKYKPNVVHVHNVKALGLLFNVSRINTVFTAHCLGISDSLIRKAKQVCVISETVGSDVASMHKIKPIVVYNGIETKAINNQASNKGNNGCFNLVQVGRMSKETKGQDILIKAVAMLKKKDINDITVDFIGDGVSMREMKELVVQLDLSSTVNFRGALSRQDIYNELCQYHLLVQPSRDEGFGLTIAEGMAAKVPVLLSSLQGPMEVVANGDYGSIFETENVEDCANRILEIKNNYDKYKTLAEKGAYQYVINNFDIVKTAERYIEVYNNYSI